MTSTAAQALGERVPADWNTAEEDRGARADNHNLLGRPRTPVSEAVCVSVQQDMDDGWTVALLDPDHVGDLDALEKSQTEPTMQAAVETAAQWAHDAEEGRQ